MKPTEELIKEHDVILQVLDAAEKEGQQLEQQGGIDPEKIEKFLDFFQNFVDRCHHGKEEKHLFFKMSMHGLPEGEGPIAVMLHEHEEGRKLIRSIKQLMTAAAANDMDAKNRLAVHLLNYVELLRIHIDKENNILFPMADKLLDDAEQSAVSEGFEKIESAEMGEGAHEKYHHLAKELS